MHIIKQEKRLSKIVITQDNKLLPSTHKFICLVNQQPNNFDFDESTNGFKLPQTETNVHEDHENISAESILARKKQLQRLLIILMGIGVSLGLILSVGIIILLNKLGLTKKPYELKQQQQQQQPLEEIHYQQQTMKNRLVID